MTDYKKLSLFEDKNKLISCLEDLKKGIFNGEFHESHLINLRSSITKIINDIEAIEVKKLILEVKLAAEIELAKLHSQML